MARVLLPQLSLAAAETALVRLWCGLEAHGLPSPKLDVAFGPDETVTIVLEFAEPGAPAALRWIEAEGTGRT